MLLVIDVGNTNITLGVFNKDELFGTFRMKTKQPRTSDEYGITLQELYNSMLVNRDQEVKVLEPGNEYKAHAIGINQTGELIVRTPDGKEKEIYAGEVSVRGVYGYV